MSDIQPAPVEPTSAASVPTTTELAPAPAAASTSTSDNPAATTPSTGFTPAALPPGNTPNPRSKNQQKKLARQAKFAATREIWKQQKKEKEKAKKARKREEARKRPHSPSGSRPGSPTNDTSNKKSKTKEPVKKEIEDITLIVDLGFDELMTDKEIVSMSSQLTRCYSANRAAQKQFKFCVSGLGGRLLERYEKAINNQHKNWRGVEWVDEYEVTEKDTTEDGDLVYLTADSPNTITELEKGKKYIIGGIVDRNRHKFLCYNKAQKQGIKHGKLPIGDYIKMASRQVLTTNQVVEIMISWLETRNWEKAFLEVIPQRKMASLKKGEEGQDGEGEEHEAGEKEDEEKEEDKKEEEPQEEDKAEGNKEEGKEEKTEGEALAEKMDVDAPEAPADEAAVQKEIAADVTAM